MALVNQKGGMYFDRYLIEKIASFLLVEEDFRTLGRCSQVCQEWNRWLTPLILDRLEELIKPGDYEDPRHGGQK
jgi:hypothetical protein